MIKGIAIHARPLMPDDNACLMLSIDGKFEQIMLNNGREISFCVDTSQRYCTGWYDISEHQAYLCEDRAHVDPGRETCFSCREKTAFNPAFYNTTEISEKQARYNNQPHSVYVAHFGGDNTKAGITADSRGLKRIYEQGALQYAVVGAFPNATAAHNLEARLIANGLRDTVRKSQKSAILASKYDSAYEESILRKKLAKLGYSDAEISTNIDHFFFGTYPNEPIIAWKDSCNISGIVRGVVGNYLILENNERLYGLWLSTLYGYQVEVGSAMTRVEHEPQQMALF